jgi:putative endonuclease
MLQCADGSIYIGMTNNILRRMQEHNGGKYKSGYTYSRRPLELIFHQEFIQFEQAKRFETKIKRWGREKKLALAWGDEMLLKELSQCLNESHYKNK